MSERVPLTAVYELVENGWVQARVEELPEVITSAPTLDEAKEDLLDALREFLLSLRSHDPHVAAESTSRLLKERLTIELFVEPEAVRRR